MISNSGALHHLHKRKRIHLKHEKYPHPDKWKRALDKLIYVVAIVGPFVSIPQIWAIWYYKSAADVSLFTWAGYLLMGFLWLEYGIVHKEKPIIITQVLWMIVHTSVVLGVVIYR